MRKTKALRIIKQMKTQNRSDRKLLLKIKELRPKTQLFSSLAGDDVQYSSIFIMCNLMFFAVYLPNLLRLKNKIPK